jgi:hypothetical protein
MYIVEASISLLSRAEGGRRWPLVPPRYSCPLFFDDVAELVGAGWDCRIFIDPNTGPIAPGTSGVLVRIAFLSPGNVLPYLAQGTEFRLWEAGTIGSGVITFVGEASH